MKACSCLALVFAVFFSLELAARANAQSKAAAPQPVLQNAASYAAIRDRSLSSQWAFERLADLTDLIGPRLSGSPGAQAAIEQVAAVMRADGLQVTLQPFRAPHWVRGEERAELVEYSKRPAGITQKLGLTALGGSVATPAEGITAQLLVVKSFAELTARAKEARGRIVVFDVPFDQELAESGHAGPAYGQSVIYRAAGATAAAKVGAVAALVRSVGGANYRLAHTGMMAYEPGIAQIPTAALTAEDVGLISRLDRRGPVSMKLVLTPQTLPDVESFNVIGDLLGSEKPDELVLVSGHLDSWDLATGATDDAVGVAAALGVAHVLRELKLRPKRTVRVVAWMSEEVGAVGGKAYFEANKAKVAQHAAAIEADFGAGKTVGIAAYTSSAGFESLRVLRDVLAPLGATALERLGHWPGADIGPLNGAGVPGFEPLLDGRHYFDYHHTPADTLDKVDPKNVQRMVATLGVLTYFLADSVEPPARVQ